MANIVVLPDSMSSVLNGGLAVARRVKAGGHNVTIVGIRDIEARVRKQGFDFAPCLEGVWPLGAMDKFEADSADDPSPPFKAMRDHQKKTFAAFLDGDLRRAVEPLKPDLFIGCSDLPTEMIAASQLGKPVLCYHTKPYCLEEMGEPPMVSDLTPAPGLGYRFQNWLAWRMAHVPRSVLFRGFLRWNYPAEFRSFAQQMGFPADKLDFDIDHIWVKLKVPYLVLFPEQLEFAREKPPAGVHYLESAADVDRLSDTPFSWDDVDSTRPLVYASMGVTGTYIHPGRVELAFHAFLKAMAERPQWQGLLSVGEHIDQTKLTVPPNVLVRKKVPQIEVLKRAAVFITQGGALSISEAVALGVPTVVIPLFYDQGAIAARVAARGLGVKVDPKQMEQDQLGKAIAQVLESPDFAQRAKTVARELLDLRQNQRTLRVVESFLPRA